MIRNPYYITWEEIQAGEHLSDLPERHLSTESLDEFIEEARRLTSKGLMHNEWTFALWSSGWWLNRSDSLEPDPETD